MTKNKVKYLMGAFTRLKSYTKLIRNIKVAKIYTQRYAVRQLLSLSSYTSHKLCIKTRNSQTVKDNQGKKILLQIS